VERDTRNYFVRLIRSPAHQSALNYHPPTYIFIWNA